MDTYWQRKDGARITPQNLQQLRHLADCGPTRAVYLLKDSQPIGVIIASAQNAANVWNVQLRIEGDKTLKVDKAQGEGHEVLLPAILWASGFFSEEDAHEVMSG